MMREHWRYIKGFGHGYQISDRGRVRNYSGKILSQHTNSNGCVRVTLYLGGERYIRSVKSLVEQYFGSK